MDSLLDGIPDVRLTSHGGVADYQTPSLYSSHPRDMFSATAPLPPPPPPVLHHDTQTNAPPLFAAVPQHLNVASMQTIPPPPIYNAQFQYPNGAVQMAPMPVQNGQYTVGPQPIPPHHLTGPRSAKRDPKRRTKTGCLTCRKRRIKCDEGHPTCRNCEKSKRGCMGYDPIFRKETGQHTPIQPAPSNSATPSSKPNTPSTSTSRQQLQTFPATGGTFVPAANPSQRLESTSEQAAPSLDPALASGSQSLAMAASSFTTLSPNRRYKPVSVEALFSLNDIPPRFEFRQQPQPNDPALHREVNDFYRFNFAPGLDKLFETRWYSVHGIQRMQQDPNLLDFVSQCMEQFRTQDQTAMRALQSTEARLVWQLASMPRGAPANDQAILDVLPRLDTVEYLITGEYLPNDRIPPAPIAAERNDAIKYNERIFWHQLGSSISHRDDTSNPLVSQNINENLNTIRQVLGIMENRDVLYSLAVERFFSGRLDAFHPHQPLVVTSNDPNDELARLEVARRHIEFEEQKGSTQVIQRICGMASRSLILQKQ